MPATTCPLTVCRFYRVLSCRFAGRRHGDAGLADREQVPRRRQLGVKEAGSSYDDQGQTAGDSEDGIFADAETDQAHTRATREGDWPAHEGHTGKRHVEKLPADSRIR
jgi:hypothetical protein